MRQREKNKQNGDGVAILASSNSTYFPSVQSNSTNNSKTDPIPHNNFSCLKIPDTFV